jgi:hypothetical protein
LGRKVHLLSPAPAARRNIGAHGRFMWDRYELLLDPACKKPVVKFTYTQAGEPPLEQAYKRRVVKIKFDPAQVYTVTLGDSVVIKDVEPDEDD